MNGAPNDGFLLNTLTTLFRLPGVLLDIYKCILSGAIKFCISSVILGQLQSFQNYHGFSVIFPKILDAI